MEWDPLSTGVPGADEDACWEGTWERTWESSPAGPAGGEQAGADWSPGDRSNPKRRRGWDHVEPSSASWAATELQTPVTDPVCGTFEVVCGTFELSEFLAAAPAEPAELAAAPAGIASTSCSR